MMASYVIGGGCWSLQEVFGNFTDEDRLIIQHSGRNWMAHPKKVEGDTKMKTSY
jgi:hypothetical protein